MQKKLTVLFMFAMFVLVVGWAITPAQAHCSGDPNHNAKHKTDPCVGAIDDITVELSGGAFVFEHGPAAVTPESEFELKGDVDVHLIRPGGAEFAPDQACITGTATDPLCIIWNGVFDLCGLLGPSDMVDVPEFFAPAGRKGWTVAKAGAEVWVSFGFPLDSPLSSEPLSVALQLKGPCPDTECGLIPGSDLVIPLDRYSIHLRGKGGVTHNAACHAAFNQLLGGDTDLVITAPTP